MTNITTTTTTTPWHVAFAAVADPGARDERGRLLHAPRTRPEYMAAAVALALEGLKPRDISDVLHLSVNGVVELLGDAASMPDAETRWLGAGAAGGSPGVVGSFPDVKIAGVMPGDFRLDPQKKIPVSVSQLRSDP